MSSILFLCFLNDLWSSFLLIIKCSYVTSNGFEIQEFVEAQRTVRSGPSTSFSREPLREIASMVTTHNPEAAGYITFALEMRHLESVSTCHSS